MHSSLETPERFAVIFDRHGDAVHRFVGFRVRRSEIDDAVAEVFRIAFEKRSDFHFTALSARPWLFGIAVNVIRRSYRTEGRKRRLVERVTQRSVALMDPLLAVDDRLDASQAAVHLEAIIDGLNDGERAVLLMTVWDELSPTEIADALSIPAATVRTRLFRARHALRRGLEIDDSSEHLGDRTMREEQT